MHRAARIIPPVGRSMRPSLLGRTIPHASHFSPTQRTFTTSLTRQSGPFSALTRQAAPLPSSSIDVKEVEPVEEADENVAEEVIDVEFEALEDARLDKALKPFETPQIPRKIQPGEPIILPLSSLAAPDPSASVESGKGIALPAELFNVEVRRDILHQCAVWWRASMRRGTHRTLGRSEVAFSKRKIRPQKKTGRARLGSAGSPMLRKGGNAHPIRPRDYSFDLPRKVRALGMRMALSSKLYMGTLRVVENLNEAGWTTTKQAHRALTTGKRLPPGWEYPDSSKITTEVKEDFFEEEEFEGDAEGKPDVVAESAPPAAVEEEINWVHSEGFGPRNNLSVLFLYPPTKTAAEIWDFARPLRNIPGVEIMSTDEVEVYHMLKFRWLVMEGGCVDAIAKQAGQAPITSKLELPAIEEEPKQQPRRSKPQKGTFIAEDGSVIGPWGTTTTPMPSVWILEKWRKHRGAKSMRKTFGMDNADLQQLLAKRAWKKLKRDGEWASPDKVALELNKRKNGGVKALGSVKH